MTRSLSKVNWILVIVGLALVVRLYRITNPVADWHSFRQADTASVTREYVKHGIDLLHPQYQDLSNIQSGLDNLEGWRMVEFPIINAVTAAIVDVTHAPLVITSRLVSVLFSLGALVWVYAFVKSLSGQRAALAAAFFMAVLPYSVYYSRAILPEAGLLFFSTLSLLTFKYWLDTQRFKWYVLSLGALIVALLLKPFVVFLAPVYAVLAWQTFGRRIFKQWLLVIYGAIAVGPFLIWREWIKQFPSGIPASDWLFNGNGIRLRPAWFRWLFWERLTVLISGYLGVILLMANVLNPHRDRWVYASWWLGIVAYFVVIATGNVQHDYYQVIATPIICISLGRGLLAMYDLLKTKINSTVSAAVSSALTIGLLLLAWQQVSGYYNVNHWEYVEAGQAVDQLVPAEAKVIAPAFGDTQFLFQTNRRGWPIGFEIDDKIAKGAQYYVTTSDDDEARQLEAKYATVTKTPKYLILNLQQPK